VVVFGQGYDSDVPVRKPVAMRPEDRALQGILRPSPEYSEGTGSQARAARPVAPESRRLLAEEDDHEDGEDDPIITALREGRPVRTPGVSATLTPAPPSAPSLSGYPTGGVDAGGGERRGSLPSMPMNPASPCASYSVPAASPGNTFSLKNLVN
jgi:hypothetical protein